MSKKNSSEPKQQATPVNEVATPQPPVEPEVPAEQPTQETAAEQPSTEVEQATPPAEPEVTPPATPDTTDPLSEVTEEELLAAQASLQVEQPVEPEEEIVEDPAVVKARRFDELFNGYVAVLTEYAERMAPNVQYVPEHAYGLQQSLIGVISGWVKLSLNKEPEEVDLFYRLGKYLRMWFAEHSEGCASPQLIHRGIVPMSILVGNAYQRHLFICSLFTRLQSKAVFAALGNNDSEIHDHFRGISIPERFIELVAEGIRQRRI